MGPHGAHMQGMCTWVTPAPRLQASACCTACLDSSDSQYATAESALMWLAMCPCVHLTTSSECVVPVVSGLLQQLPQAALGCAGCSLQAWTASSDACTNIAVGLAGAQGLGAVLACSRKLSELLRRSKL